MISQKNKQGWRNPWLIGLLTIVIAGVLINARMLWNVLHHPTRLLDENYSVKAHNQYDAKWVQQQAERSTLGWHAELDSPQRIPNDSMAMPSAQRYMLNASPALMRIELRSKEGLPIAGAKVLIAAQWPGDPNFDFNTAFNEISAGNYAADVKFSRAGNWDMLISAQRENLQFSMEQKVFVAIPKQP